MDWIILNSGVPNLFEDINPLDGLTKQVSDVHSLSALSGIMPSFANALLL